MSFTRAHQNKILPGPAKLQAARRGFKPPVIVYPMEGHIPKEFGRIKLNDDDFMGKPKFNFFRKFKSPQVGPRVEVRAEPLPKKKHFFFARKPYVADMGCIRSKVEKDVDVPNDKSNHVEVKEPEKTVVPNAAPAKEKPSDDLLQTRQECLKAHNVYRAKHGSPAVTLKDELNEMAQKWADHLADIKTLQHSECKIGDVFVGENVAYKWMSSGGEFSGQEVTDNWYSEISKYDYSVGRSQGTGHFTQVVWKSSLEIGVGKAQASDGSFYVVANYLPAGNVIGRFEENVLKPK